MSRSVTRMFTPVHSVSILSLIVILATSLCKLIFVCVLLVLRRFFITFVKRFIMEFFLFESCRSVPSRHYTFVSLILLFHRLLLCRCSERSNILFCIKHSIILVLTRLLCFIFIYLYRFLRGI